MFVFEVFKMTICVCVLYMTSVFQVYDQIQIKLKIWKKIYQNEIKYQLILHSETNTYIYTRPCLLKTAQE